MKRLIGLIGPVSNFAITLFVALFLFTLTAVEFPGTMRAILNGAASVRDFVERRPISDAYLVWIHIFLEPDLTVLVLYSIVTRLIGEAGHALLNGWRFPDGSNSTPAPGTPSPFNRWG